MFLPISGGESHYLSFAKQFMDPNWIPGSFSLTEFAGTRLIFQWIIGSVMKIFDFETTAVICRIFNYVLVSIPLALIFDKLKLRIFEWLIMFQLFIMSGQSFFAKEWIFGTFEPKTLAYAFVLFAFYNWMCKRHFSTMIFLALATYFHVLVGGWILVVIILAEFANRNFKFWLKPLSLYTLLILPLFLYLIQGYFGSTHESGDLNTNFAYVYYRLPHHLGLVKSWPYFFDIHFTGILLTLISFILLFRFRKFSDSTQKRMMDLVLIAFAINLFFVLVAIVDSVILDRSGGLLLKYYPFRTNSFGLFIIYLLVIKRLSARQWFGLKLRWLSPFLMILTIILMSSKIQYAFDNQRKYHEDVDYFELMNFIKSNTEEGSTFMLLDLPDRYFLPWSFHRLSERELFVTFKFVPAEKQKLSEWYSREILMKKIRNGKIPLETALTRYQIPYVISKRVLDDPNGQIVHSNSSYYLYKY